MGAYCNIVRCIYFADLVFAILHHCADIGYLRTRQDEQKIFKITIYH